LDSRKILVIVAGVLPVVVAVWYGMKLFSSPKKATPQQLAETALSASAPQRSGATGQEDCLGENVAD
jgi:hypothetical protein